MLLLVILGAIALVAMRIAGVGSLAKKKTPTPSVSVSCGSMTTVDCDEMMFRAVRGSHTYELE